MLFTKLKYFIFNKPRRPAAVQNLEAIASSDTTVDLSWTLPDNLSSYVRIEWGVDSAAYTNLLEVSGSLTGYTISDLTPDQKYYFRITRLNYIFGNSSDPSSVTATPTGGKK